MSSGEITIHPYRKRIYNLTKGKNATFYTNGFIFDENIAGQMKGNPGTAINVSIDAGTAETWKKIKGVDNFEEVCMNLADYYKASCRPGQVTLKYIILPGINDSEEDYESLMDIMGVLETPHLTLARDGNKKYGAKEKEEKQLLDAAVRLAVHCKKKGIAVDMFTYQPWERQEIISRVEQMVPSR